MKKPMKVNTQWLDAYQVDESELQRDVCNLFFDEDSLRYNTPCRCSRCFKDTEFKLGGLK